MIIEIEGRRVEVDDSFGRMPPDQQQRTVNEIAATFRQQQQAAPRETSTLGAANAFATNLSNSLLFGIPEAINRRINPESAQYYDQMRQDYPTASTAGDIFGMANPARLGIKAGGAVVSNIGRRMAPEAVESAGKRALDDAAMKNAQAYQDAAQRFDIAQARARLPNASPDAVKAAEQAQANINKIAKELNDIEKTAQKSASMGVFGRTAKVGAQTTGGIMGLQMGAGGLGGARSENYGAGFQQGAQSAGQAIRNYNPLQAVPGVPQVTQGVTNIVPGMAGYGSMVADKAYMTVEEMIREEAARKALQGPR